MNQCWMEEIPIDAARSSSTRPRSDDLAWGDEEINRNVMGEHRDPVGDDLKWVHNGCDGRRFTSFTFLTK